MKKALTFALAFLLILPTPAILAQNDVGLYTKDILALYGGVTEEELQKEIAEAAQALNVSEEEIAKQIYAELRDQEEQALAENDFVTELTPFATKYTLGSSSKGNIFYETASTSGIAHGHVGMYYSSSTLVESVGSGVRSLSRTNKKVVSGAKIQAVRAAYASTTEKNNAANWAYSRRGDKYSYNFATNRQTSCTGAKNCSKLVWCAFKLKAGIDIDKNKGLGVYPKDIRDSSLVYTIKSY